VPRFPPPHTTLTSGRATFRFYLGDSLDVLDRLAEGSVDAIVTDPPYGLRFMGKHWDHGVPGEDFWREALRVAKPSSYLLAFGGTRTVHRLACAIEDAGWLIRDMLVWAYAQGFPKSEASLKPAWEPIVMARKPGPLRELAIDQCRIGNVEVDYVQPPAKAGYESGSHLECLNVKGKRAYQYSDESRRGEASSERRYGGNGIGLQAAPGPRGGSPSGRWPANVILTDPIFDGRIEGVVGGGESKSGSRNGEYSSGDFFTGLGPVANQLSGDSGYSRFFLIPKADRTDREPVLRTDRGVGSLRDGGRESLPRRNHHPTVKPVDLMRHLVRLVTPTGGTVLDPFLGSGSTAIAAEMEGCEWIGIEKEVEYVAIVEARLNGTQRGFGLGA